MDHLWLDRECQDEPPLVPYCEPGLWIYEYDEDDSWMTNWDGNLPSHGAVMLQEGLFFRAIARWCHLLDLPFDRDDHIRERDGQRVWSLLKLERQCNALVAGRTRQSSGRSWKQSSRGPIKRRGRACGTLLNSISRSLWRLSKIEPGLGLHMAACSALVELLVTCSFDLGFAIDLFNSASPALDKNVLQEFARKTGLCINRLQILGATAAPTSSTILAISMRYQGDHTKCNASDPKCAANEVVELPLHYECNGCQLVRLCDREQSKLEIAIDEVGYGLLHFGDDLEVVQADEYIAFSHVWKHGLGNPNANALPTCQLTRLKNIVGDAPFWIDTLCVPLGTSKQRALHKMGDVYKRAKVYVLDNHLLNVRGDVSLKQVALLMSDWMSRLWTYQEALLPREVCVLFGDGVMSIHELIVERRIGARCFASLKLYESLRERDLMHIALAFGRRSVTEKTDEAVCLSILLNVAIARSVPDVLRQLSEVDQNIVFVEAARCEEPGLRWCPLTLLGHTGRHTLPPEPRRIGFRGIHIKKHIIAIGNRRYNGRDVLALGDDLLVVPGAWADAGIKRFIKDAAIVIEQPKARLERGNSRAIMVSRYGEQARLEGFLWVASRRWLSSTMGHEFPYGRGEGVLKCPQGLKVMTEAKMWLD